MLLYVGRRIDGVAKVVQRMAGGVEVDLPMRLDKCNHSPTGYDWGYGGSGPAQLAFAILAAQLPADLELAYDLHQSFKRRVISNLPKGGWVMDEYEVDQWIYNQLEIYQWTTTEAVCA